MFGLSLFNYKVQANSCLFIKMSKASSPGSPETYVFPLPLLLFAVQFSKNVNPLLYYLASRRKLQEWREAKGVSYKRPPMPVKPQVRRTVAVPQPFWATMKEEDEAHSLIRAVDRSLADCIKLIGKVFCMEGGISVVFQAFLYLMKSH